MLTVTTEEPAGDRCQEATGTSHASHLFLCVLGINSVPGTVLGSVGSAPALMGFRDSWKRKKMLTNTCKPQAEIVLD